MIKNAISYITRKRHRSLIILIILTIVLSSLFASLSILNMRDSMEKNILKASNASVSISKKGENGYFDKDDFSDLKNIKGLSGINYQYENLARLKKLKVVDIGQQVTRDDIPEDLKNLVSLNADSQIDRNTLFSSGVFTLVSGRKLNEDDQDKVMIHEDFAKKNKLKLKDKITIEKMELDNKTNNKELNLEVVGIFSGKKQEKFTGLSSDLSENFLFTNYKSLKKSFFERDHDLVSKITLYAEEPKLLDDILGKVKEIKVDWAKYRIEKDTSAFEEILESLSGIKSVLTLASLSLILAGILVITLVLALYLRERLYEIGILLSTGFSKIKILGQFILELFALSLISLIISSFLGKLLLNLFKANFFENEGNFQMISNGIVIDPLTMLKSYGILLLIIIISVVLSSALILTKKPKEILSKIS